LHIFENFKYLIKNSKSKEDFDIDFTHNVLLDIDFDDYEKIHCFIEQTLNIYPLILSMADKGSIEQQNKYLKQLFLRYIKEQSYALAFSTLIMKNPILLNKLDSQYNKKLATKNLYEQLKKDIAESDTNGIIESEESKKKLAEYLEKEILLIMENNSFNFNKEVYIKSKNIFELQIKDIFNKFTEAQEKNISIEEFWDTY